MCIFLDMLLLINDLEFPYKSLFHPDLQHDPTLEYQACSTLRLVNNIILSTSWQQTGTSEFSPVEVSTPSSSPPSRLVSCPNHYFDSINDSSFQVIILLLVLILKLIALQDIA